MRHGWRVAFFMSVLTILMLSQKSAVAFDGQDITPEEANAVLRDQIGMDWAVVKGWQNKIELKEDWTAIWCFPPKGASGFPDAVVVLIGNPLNAEEQRKSMKELMTIDYAKWKAFELVKEEEVQIGGASGTRFLLENRLSKPGTPLMSIVTYYVKNDSRLWTFAIMQVRQPNPEQLAEFENTVRKTTLTKVPTTRPVFGP